MANGTDYSGDKEGLLKHGIEEKVFRNEEQAIDGDDNQEALKNLTETFWAPEDGKTYGRKDGRWVEASGGVSTPEDLQETCGIGSDWDMTNSNSHFTLGSLVNNGVPNSAQTRWIMNNVESNPSGNKQMFSRSFDSNGDLEFVATELFRYASSGASGYTSGSRQSHSTNQRADILHRTDGFAQIGVGGINNHPDFDQKQEVSLNFSKLADADIGVAYFTRNNSGFDSNNRKKYFDEMVRIEGELFISNSRESFVTEQSGLRIESLATDKSYGFNLVYDDVTGDIKKRPRNEVKDKTSGFNADTGSGNSIYVYNSGSIGTCSVAPGVMGVGDSFEVIQISTGSVNIAGAGGAIIIGSKTTMDIGDRIKVTRIGDDTTSTGENYVVSAG